MEQTTRLTRCPRMDNISVAPTRHYDSPLRLGGVESGFEPSPKLWRGGSLQQQRPLRTNFAALLSHEKNQPADRDPCLWQSFGNLTEPGLLEDTVVISAKKILYFGELA